MHHNSWRFLQGEFGDYGNEPIRLSDSTAPHVLRTIVERNLPFYARLGAEDREELELLIMIFIAEKSFEGCGGQTIDDEVRSTVEVYLGGDERGPFAGGTKATDRTACVCVCVVMMGWYGSLTRWVG